MKTWIKQMGKQFLYKSWLFLLLQSFLIALLGLPWIQMFFPEKGEEIYRFQLSKIDSIVTKAFSFPYYKEGALILLILYLYVVWKSVKAEQSMNVKETEKNVYGGEKFLTKRDIRRSKHLTLSLKPNTFILCKIGRKFLSLDPLTGVKSINKNVMIIGSTGRGKNSGFIDANVINNRSSMILLDVSGLLYERTAAMKRYHAKNVYVFNAIDIKNSCRFNPLDYIEAPTDADVISLMLLEQATKDHKESAFFHNMAKGLISAIILYVKYVYDEPQQHLGSVYRMLTDYNQDYNGLKELFEKLHPFHPARSAFTITNPLTDKETNANVFASAVSSLEIFKNPHVRYWFSGNDFRFEQLGKEETVVYVTVNEADDTYAALIGTFFDLAFKVLSREAKKRKNTRLAYDVVFALDELPNISKIPNLGNRLSTFRKYGMSSWISIQNRAGLEERYGKNETEMIIDAADTKMFVGTNNDETARWVSDLLGPTTKIVPILTEGDKSDSVAHQPISQPLMNHAEVINLPKENVIIKTLGHRRPILAKKAWFPEVFPKVKSECHLSTYKAPKQYWYTEMGSKGPILVNLENIDKEIREYVSSRK